MAAEGPDGSDLACPGPTSDCLRVYAKEGCHLGRRQECIRWSGVGHVVRLPFGLSDLRMNVRQRTFAVDGPFGSFFGLQVTSYLGMDRLGGRVTVRSESPFRGTRGGPQGGGMDVFERIGGDDYEQVVYCHDRPSGLRAIIAVHSTTLGPALGGTRFYPYPSEDAALEDVLRLARGMTYKSAVAGLDLGGGKAVVLGDPSKDKTEALMRAYARFVDALGGRYI